MGVSQEILQNMTDEEFVRANFEACQEAVRRTTPDKKAQKAQLRANLKHFRKVIKKVVRDQVQPEAEAEAEVDSNNNNNNKDLGLNVTGYGADGYWHYFNEKGEEISDWDDQNWDEVNAWFF